MSNYGVVAAFRSAPLAAGAHSIDIQWRLVGVVAASITIDPTGAAPVGHASLNVDEVTA